MLNIKRTMESQQVEYKRSFGKEVIISLVAFANTEGGRVIVGVDDKGKVCGVDLGPETVQRYLNEIKMATYPQLLPKMRVEKKDGGSLLIIEVTEYPTKPVAYKNRYYRRVHNSNQLLTLNEIVELQQQSLSISYDAYPAPVGLADLDKGLIGLFFDRVNSRGRVALHDDLFTNLVKLKLVRDGKLTIAAKLLFGDPEFAIRVGRFKSAATIIDDNVVKGPLLKVVDEAMTFIKKHINLSYHFDGSIQRKERWQYPIEALRELLLNCVVHRDYKNFSDIVIKIFDDRIIFTNPGRLYGNLKLADLERDDYVSSIRNKLLAEAFYLTGDIERYGTGFLRIREALKEYPELALSVEEVGDFLKVELRAAKEASSPATTTVATTVATTVTTTVATTVERLLSLCQKDIGREDMQKQLGIKNKNHFLKSYLNPTIAKGLVEMTIPDKPNSSRQKYRLTESGRQWLEEQKKASE
jgi:ATP-dependent DNA helicase RecG